MPDDLPTLSSTLDALRLKTGSDSDSARAIGCTRQDIYLARKRGTMPDRAIIAAAVALSVSPPYLLAAIHADTSTDDTAKAVWLEMAISLTPAPPALPLYYVKSEGARNENCCQNEKPKNGKIRHDQTAVNGNRLHCLPLSDEKKIALEVLQWCLMVARIPPDSPRLPYYVSRWNVPAKIAAARASNTLADTLNDCPTIDLRHIPAALAAIAESDTYNRTAPRPKILQEPEESRLQA